MIEEYLFRRLEVKTFPQSVIESLHYKLDVLIRDLAEIEFLREILANETIHVFVRSSLPLSDVIV
jgi:hypothetical protein